MENTNNNTQPDYLNPESDKYYKGYRYEKNEFGSDCWYDDNGKVRKRIFYHDNGNKCYEYYYDEKRDLHNEDGYAYQSWDEDGNIKRQEYWLNDVYLTEEEWKEKTGRIVSTQPDYLNPESPKYYKGYKCVINGNLSVSWHNDNGIMMRGIRYWNNGNKSHECYFNEESLYHNKDGAAFIIYDENGEVKTEEFYLNGKAYSKLDFFYKTKLINVI